MTSLLRRLRDDQAGSLVFVVLAGIVAGGLMVVLLNYAVGARKHARIDREFTDALPVAETGVEVAITRLRKGAGEGVSAGALLPDGDTDPDWTLGTIQGDVYRYQARKVSTTTWDIRSQGCATAASVSSFADCLDLPDDKKGRVRTVEARVQRTAFFWLAAFGDTRATFPGNNAVTTMPGLGTGLGQVGSNGQVIFDGNAEAEGVVLYGDTSECKHHGPNGDCQFDDGAGGTTPVIHETDTRDITSMFDSEDYEARCPASQGPYEPFMASDFGGVVPPSPTGYYCASSVWFDVPTTITGSAADPVVIYAEGDVRVPLLPGTGVNCDPLVCTTNGPDTTAGSLPDPRSLQIYVSGSSSNVEFNPNTYFAGAIFAPGATCDGLISNASVEYYGSLICGEIFNVGGWHLYFDPRLVEVGSDEFHVEEWREEVGGSTSIP